ncbi:MAG: ECF-type sigma factor [Phycisphaerales bacterium]
MPEPDQNLATRIVGELAAGDGRSAPELARLVYDNLRRYAAVLAAEGGAKGGGGGGAVQPTALVHEAYLRLVDQSRVDWQGRTHFFAVGAEMIRRVLVDEARRRGTAKRGGDWRRVSLGGEAAITDGSSVDVVALDEALRRLVVHDPRAARVVELRFFGGLREQDVADLLGVSAVTIRKDWRAARAWLRDELRDEGEAGGASDADR